MTGPGFPHLSHHRHRRFTYREPDALLQDVRALGLDIPWSQDISPLLEPLILGFHTLPNRLVVQPMEGFDADPHGGPGPEALRRYRRYAEGGAGLIWFEATAVVEEARSNPRQLFLHPGNVESFRQLVSEVRLSATRALGLGHTPLLILQLTHSGRWSRPGGERRPLIAHHVAKLDAIAGIDDAYPVATDEELEHLQDIFVAAAGLAARAGFDGVDMKACHGYLASELLGAFNRAGPFGGSLENRSRFLLETAARIREAQPGLLVTTRMNAFDGLSRPHGFGANADDPPAPDPAEPVQVLRRLQEDGASLANVTLGIPYANPHLGRPFNKEVPGAAPAPEHPLIGIDRFQRVTGTLQKALPTLPLVGTGYSWLRQFFPNVGAGAIRSGGASLVGVGRMAFAYPDFARDLAEHGSLDPRKSCVGCSGCSYLMKVGEPTGCVVRDGSLYQLPETRERKRGRE